MDFDTSAIGDSGCFGGFPGKHAFEHEPNIGVGFLGLLRGRRAAGADGPDWFIKNDRFLHLLVGKILEAGEILSFKLAESEAPLAFLDTFANANDRTDAGFQKRPGFFSDSIQSIPSAIVLCIFQLL